MRRRQALRAISAAGTAVVAGCGGRWSASSETVLKLGEPAVHVGTELLVTEREPSPRVRRIKNPMYGHPVAAGGDAQYLLVGGQVDRSMEWPPSLRVEASGAALSFDRDATVRFGVTEGPQIPPGIADLVDDRNPLRISALVPVAGYDEVSVVWTPSRETFRWPLPDELVENLGEVPAFAVESLSVPETVWAGNRVPISATIRNDGDRRGHFQAVVSLARADSAFETVWTTVPAGGTADVEADVRAAPRDAERVTVELDWGLGNASVTAPVRS